MPTDAELLRQYARWRDDAAFGRIVARHARALRRVAYRHTHHRQASEDVAQAAFLVLAQRPWPAMRSARRKRSVLPWLAKVARYAAANWRRAETRRRRREIVVARPEATWDPTAGYELGEAVQSALSCLPRRERRIVQWRHLSGMAWDEVARHAGTTPEAARKTGTRALSQLRVVLDKRGITAGSAAILVGLRALATSSTASAAASVTAPEIAKGVLIMMKAKFAAAAAAACLVAGAGSAGLVFAGSGGESGQATTPATASSTTAPAASPEPFRIDLAGGGKLEVMAIAEHKPDGRAWHADGTPLPERPQQLPAYLDREGLLEVWLRHDPGGGTSRMSVTMEPVPPDSGTDEMLIWEQEIRRQHLMALPDRETMNRMNDWSREQGVMLVLIDPKAGASTLGVNLTVPMGDWQTVQEWSEENKYGDRIDSVAGGMVVEMMDVEANASVSTSWIARGLSAWETKAQMVTTDGKVQDFGHGEWINGGQTKKGNIEVEGVSREDVAHFQLIARPKGLVKLRGLAAAPGVVTTPIAEKGERGPLPWERDEEELGPLPAAFNRPLGVPLDLAGSSLTETAAFLEKNLQLPVRIDRARLEAAGIDPDAVTIPLAFGEEVHVSKAFDLIARQAGVAVRWNDGFIFTAPIPPQTE